nr:hypothetical protein [Tanacetum cinerariifolium]
MRIEQYFLMTDYSLWEVILNGDSPIPTRVVEGVLQPVAPTTAEQKLARKNELKARGTLLMALLDKHQLKFNSRKDAKTLMEAIKKRFGGKTETKKVQKTLLKQKYENFSVSIAASVFVVCAKLPVSSLPNVDSLRNAIDVDDLEEIDLRWQMAMLTMGARRFLQKTGKNLGANGPTSMGLDMSKVKCYNCHRKGHFARECRSLKDLRRTGSYDWSYQAEEELANYALMAFSSSSSDNELSPTKLEQDLSHTTRPTAPIIEDWVSDFKDKSETKAPQFVPSFVQSSEQIKSPRHSVQPVKTSIPAATPTPASPKSASSGKKRNKKACFVCKSVDRLIKYYDYHAKKMAQPTLRNYAQRGNHKQYAPLTHTTPQKHMVPPAMLTHFKPVSNIVVRPVSAAMLKINVTRLRYAHPVVTKSKSPIRRHITRSPSPKTNNSPPRVTAVQAPVVSAAQGIQGKWGNPQHILKDKGVIDSGCSRNMTGNMSYLSDFKELNGGYVAFRGNPKGGKISGKGKVKTNSLLPIPFWAEAVNTACYVHNKVLVTKPHNKTPYELLHGRTLSISFMRPFGCLVTILNTLDPLGKFEGKVDEGFLVGYSISSKAFRVFNCRARIIQETLHVNFLENKPNVVGSGPTWLFDIDSITRTMNYQPINAGNQTNLSADAAFDGKEHDFDAKKPESKVNVSPSSSAQSRKQDDKTKKEAKGKNLLPDDPDMPELEDITYSDDEDDVGVEADFNNFETSITASPIPTTRIHKDHPMFDNDFHTCMFACILSHEEPKRVHQPLKDPSWIEAMQKELLQFKMQKVWVLVDLPHGKRAIGTKWVYRNKMDERGILMPPSYDLWCYQMDVKSAFLYGTIEEELYVCQTLGFEDLDHPDKVYKVVKALYGFHQAPRAWYETLANYLLENSFQRGKIDQTLFIKKHKGDILLVQIYVDDIIFGATNKDLCKSFEKLMKDKLQMSSIGELTFFLGLKVKQKKDGIFISQDKYVAKILRKFGLTEGKSASTPIDIEKHLLKDLDGKDVDVHTYRSMIGSLTYLTSSRPDIMFAAVLSGMES